MGDGETKPGGGTKNSRRFIFGGVGAILLLLLLGTAALVKADRQSTFKRLEQDGNGLATALAEHSVRLLAGLDQGLRAFAYAIERDGTSFSATPLIENGLLALDIAVDFLFIDNQGIEHKSATNHSERDYFIVHTSSQKSELFIGKPIKTSSMRKALIPITRGIRDKNGTLRGVVLAAIDPAYFTRFYSGLTSDRNSRVMVVGNDGVIRGHSMSGEADAALDISASQLFPLLAKAPHGLIRSIGPFEGMPQLYSVAQVPTHPLLATVAFGEAEALEAYRLRRTVYAGAAFLGSLVIAIFAFFLSQQMASQEVINDSLRESEERFRLMVETSPFPLVLTRLADHGVLYINRRASEMLGISQEQAVGHRMPDYYDDPRQRVEFIKQVNESGFIDDHEFCLKRNNGKRFWALLSATTVRYCGEMALLTGINDISERKQLEDELKRRAITDSLTGVANRAYFLEQGNQQFQLAKRYGHRLSVLMIDIDFFKKINDTYGHHVGDIALQAMTELCVDTLREVDIFGRMGGEEFAAALPSTAQEGASLVAERLRIAIDQAEIPIGDGRCIKFSVSIGVAQIKLGDASIEDALKRADEALYAAKHGGRNRVEVAA